MRIDFISYEERKKLVIDFYKKLGIEIPKDKEDLAVQSLTMKEYNEKYHQRYKTDYKDHLSLSTLGDAVCGLYVMDNKFKYDLTQEELTNEKVVVKNNNLNIIGKNLLNNILFSYNNDLFNQETKIENTKAYATAFEAFIGFVYKVDKEKAFEILDEHLKQYFEE